MKEVKWSLQKFEQNQKNGILELRKIVFKDEDADKENGDFWDWQFQDNYAGMSKIYLAVDNEKVVGHYAVCPSKILVDGETRKGSIVVDVMTHPDYRFQGMFTKIGKYSLDESGKDGIDFSYGFPIRKSVMPGHLKIGWKIAFPLPVYVYPVDFSKIICKFLPCKPLAAIIGFFPQILYSMIGKIGELGDKKYTIVEKKNFENTKELQEFIEKTHDQHRIMQMRDYSFLDWRYNTNHYREYKLFFAYDMCGKMVGYVVVRHAYIYELDCMTIIDIQVLNCDKSVINTLLRTVHRYAKQCRTALVGCMTNTKNKYKRQMLANLYLKSPYIFKFIIHQNNDMNYFDKLLDSKNWFITWADTDDL